MSGYRQGWATLNQLLHEGKSFSGYERNCAFLNLGGDSFADVSGLIGVNYHEDARALISTDWDFDGDLDLWTTARTAPRLRFLKNNSIEEQQQFLGIRLVGNATESNRDAVGAIVELYLENDSIPIIRTVTAGDAFLSQNSQWLLFHFSADSSIKELIIHWPGGKQQAVHGLLPMSFNKIHQGEQPVIWQTPAVSIELEDRPVEFPETSQEARIVLTGRLPLTPIYIQDDGKESELPLEWLKGPLLLNLWAPWCQPCVEELSSWSQSGEDFQKVGLRVLALNADNTKVDEAKRLLRRLRFPYQSGHTTPRTVRQLDWFQRAFLDHWSPLPIPSSFLIDRKGEVAVIYKGAVAPEQIMKDMELLDLDPTKRREEAIPFQGKWLKPPRLPNPLLVNGQFVAHDALDEGIIYLQRYLKSIEAREYANVQQLASIAQTIGTLLSKTGVHSTAKSYLIKALQLMPENAQLRLELAGLLLNDPTLDHIQEAIAILKPDPKVQVTDPASRRLLSQAYLFWGESFQNNHQYSEAEQAFRQSIQLDSTQVKAAEKLAWSFVAHVPEQGQRKSNALAIAERLCSITRRNHAGYLDLLAYIQGVHGNFEQAIRIAEEAQILRTDDPNSKAFKVGVNRINHFKRHFIPDLRSESD